MSEPAPRTFTTELSVRGYEMDASGTVPVATLARYMEHGRWLTMSDPAFPLHGRMRAGVVRAQQIRLPTETRFPDRLVVETSLARVGRTSVSLGSRIARAGDGVTVAEALCTLVNLGPDGPAPLPDAVREAPTAPVLVEVPPPGDEPETREGWTFPVAESDLDMFHHVNQGRWIALVCDAAERDDREAGRAPRRPTAVSIEYRAEGKLGAPLTVHFGTRSAQSTYIALHSSGSVSHVRARLCYG